LNNITYFKNLTNNIINLLNSLLAEQRHLLFLDLVINSSLINLSLSKLDVKNNNLIFL